MSRTADSNEDGKIQICFHSYQLLHYFHKSRVGKQMEWIHFKYRTIKLKQKSRNFKKCKKLRKTSKITLISTVIHTYIYIYARCENFQTENTLC